MCDAPDEPKSEEPPTLHVAPPGHSRAGHRAFGWCSRCSGREVWEELLAWRQRDNEATDESPTPDRATSLSREGEEKTGRD
ncbi:hypothetical protein OG840_33890 [Streptomyces sp. NBC_01764]|uniref:hypothetical protein n=1 Tax=Streptomyces sp. NBC_01764 TaxID=2975935 RepID=UPI00225A46A0|nr:hypothetical protein [Streptomyces sp. NBC_01764]MCX4406449.1 hypothetical protein [Streptomyces sp. NBC_01764]